MFGMESAAGDYRGVLPRSRKAAAFIPVLIVSGLLVLGGATPASAQVLGSASEPEIIGLDGTTLFTPLPEMVPTESSPQGQLEKGSDGDFFSAARTRTGAAEDGRIYRYFEYDDPREPMFWNASDAGVAGPVLSMSTDAAGFVYSLHTPTEAGSHGLIAKWSAEGLLQNTRSITIPDLEVDAILAIDVDPSGEMLTSLIESASSLASADVWTGSWSTPEPVLRSTESVYNLGDIAPPFSRQVLPPDYPGGPSNTVYSYQIGPDAVYFEVAGYTATQMRIDMRGIDTSTLPDDRYLFVSASGNIAKVAPGTGLPVSELTVSGAEGFDLYQSRIGNDGRLYVSGVNTAGEWSVKPFEMRVLKSPELAYSDSEIDINTCAIDPISVPIDGEQLRGSPEPSWFGVEEGELPDGIRIDAQTGTLSGASAEAFAERTITVRAANGVTSSASSAPTTTELTLRSATETMSFDKIPTPQISGENRPGNVLSVSPGQWEPAATLSVQWMRDGAPIDNATSRDYVVAPSDVGTQITVVVTASADCRTEASKTSPPVTIVPKPTVPSPEPASPNDGIDTPLSVTGAIGGAPFVWIGSVLLVAGAGAMLALRLRTAGTAGRR